VQSSWRIGRIIRDTGEGRSRSNSPTGVIGSWVAKSAFFVGRLSVDFWFGALGNRLVSPCSDPNSSLRQPASS